MRFLQRRISEIQLWTIPTNWQWATIADIGEVVSGGTPSTKNPSFWGGAINWISPADLSGYNNKFIFKGAKSLTEVGLENSSAKLMPAGSIHFSSRAPIGYVVISKANISTSQGFKSIVPAKGIFNEYVYYFLKSAKRIAEERASGTTFKELSGKAFSELPIPIPPVDEQYRIVAKIDELFSELDQGIESLKTCREHLKVYRQVVLKHAFEGKLTEQWRNAHADQLETAEQLLAQIKEEREQRYQQQLEEWNKAVQLWEEGTKQDKKPSKPQKLEELTPLKEQELIKLPRLPHQWCWEQLAAISIEITDGDHQVPPKANLGVPFIVISNIKNNQIDFTETQYVPRSYYEALQKKRQPTKGDILYTVTGSFGIPCLIDFDKEFCFQRHISLIRLELPINKKFIFYFLQSRLAFQQALNVATGTAQKTLPLGGLRRCSIPIVPFNEQIQIVDELESQLSVVEQLEVTINSSLEKSEIQLQSILKKAFSGELVPQDPNEESANVLLQRIRAEREAKPKPTRKPFKNRKKEIDTV